MGAEEAAATSFDAVGSYVAVGFASVLFAAVTAAVAVSTPAAGKTASAVENGNKIFILLKVYPKRSRKF